MAAKMTVQMILCRKQMITFYWLSLSDKGHVREKLRERKQEDDVVYEE